MEHELKTDPEVFEAKMQGVKPWDIRRNDRNFQVGDTLRERETKHSWAFMLSGCPLEYTGREIRERVTYILRGPQYGFDSGYCIMTTERI